MDAKIINHLPIRNYLAGLNIHPAMDKGYYGMYHSPFREDHNASMKVDYDKNLWIDYGTGEGGTLIDLVMKINHCSFQEAAKGFENNSAYMHISSDTDKSSSFHGNKFSNKHENNIENIIPITHPALIAWVQERRINLDLANRYCREVHYKNNDRDYFSIGFRNDKGGYELSSPSGFKGCTTKEITTIGNNADAYLVFEGFWDFLSYLAIQKIEKTKHDVVVLNSVANIQKAMDFLKSHKEIFTYLDNDDAGRKATKLIQSIHFTVYNRSTGYAEYKDVNDYLCGKKLLPEKKKNQGQKL